ncbi:hypothetical protein [Chryseobacterium indoltheticum]|uniref:hypothetical protein n=1 Tax=Chryseobacterium indoltheticum TaxID=254 RepID=UPI003F49ADDB
MYDEADDLKLKNAYTDFSGIGSAASIYTYKPEFFNADHYFYGKIASVQNTTYRDGNSFTVKDETEYFPNGNLSHFKKYSNDSSLPPVITSYTYTNSGNLETETISTLVDCSSNYNI